MSKVNYIPDGYHTATPYLIVNGAAAALDYYANAFGATELFRLPGPDGKIGHCEFKIGNSIFMMADEHTEMGARGPKTIGGSPISIMLYVEDVDTMFNRAIANGGTVERPIENKFYGDRAGGIIDPFGHKWYIATHIEDVSPEELSKRLAAMGQGG